MSKILIYWKWKVGQSLVLFCQKNEILFDICDDSDAPTDFSGYTHIIPSPGIPSSHLVYASNKVMSELDFLYKYVPKGFQIHAVTGTDGKSTTSHILYHFLKAWFPDSPIYIGGNFGIPFADVLSEISEKWEKEGHIVLEVSSFMAYHISTFYADTTIITNLHSDHLDWHRDLSEYYNAKQNLLAHTKNLIIYPESIIEKLPELPHFPIKKKVMPLDINCDNNILQIEPGIYIDISDRQLFWHHNVENIFFAASLACHLGISVKCISQTIPFIVSLPHRLEKISEKHNKYWIDDSKSTTALSLYAALQSFDWKKVYLIAGWKDKGDSFEELGFYLKKYCEYWVFIGETKSVFLQAAHDAFVPSVSVSTLQEAVAQMSEMTKEWDIILLSPWCSSLDMFINYEDRAQKFSQEISALE